MMKYYMFEETLKDELTGEKYRCFGGGYGEHRFSDVCLEEAPVREFVRTLNEEQLEPIHFSGAVEDFIQGLESFQKERRNF